MISKYLIKFYTKLLLSHTRKRFDAPVCNTNESSIVNNIAIIYSIPKNSPRLNTWNDGFVEALHILSSDYTITWINIEVDSITEEYLNSFDFLLVKSNWDWGPDKLLREKFRDLKVKKGLAIAGVSLPPSFQEMLYYDVLWYETDWYKRIIKNHPNIYHGFGINKNDLKVNKVTPTYDYITIGAFLPHKRMHYVSKLKGSILVIGEKYDSPYSDEIIGELERNKNIDIMPFVEYSQLSNYLCLAKTLYMPAAINGGGERAILEARHCGLRIKIESDNPKLLEIKKSPIWDSQYYSRQILKGIKSL